MTETPVYIGYKTPLAGSLFYRTVVHLGVIGMSGNPQTDQAAVDWAFTEFGSGGPANTTNFGGTALRYYSDFNTTYISLEQLLAHHDAQCHSWALLFSSTLVTQGIASKVTKISTRNSAERFGLSAITFGQADNPAGAPAGYTHSESAVSVQQSGPAAQGVLVTPTGFQSHFVVEFGTTVYDPSYGKLFSGPTLGSARRAWEAESVTGFKVFVQTGVNDDGDAIYAEYYREELPLLLELVFE